MRFFYMCAVLIFYYDSSVYSTDEPQNVVSCGPKDLCECTSGIEMNCDNRDVKLKDVCDYINSPTTHFNVTVLRVVSLTKGIHMLRKDDLQGCQELMELYLSKNGMCKIETDAFHGFERLEMLDMSNNDLNLYNANQSEKTNFPANIKKLKLMGNYNMSMYDNLSYPDLSGLEELQSLFIDGLPFIDFNRSYRSLKNLSSVSMSGLIGHCNISSVTNTTFIHLPNLGFLNISACNITDIEAFGFGDMLNLENLDLYLNMRLGFQALKNITYGFQYSKIRVLNISKIHTTFGPGTRIQIDDICYLGNTSLQEVDLSSNRIEFFENNALAVLPASLNIVRMEYNKFTFRPYLLQLGCLKNVTEFYGSFQHYTFSPLVFINESQGLNDRNYSTPDYVCPFLKETYVQNDQTCPFFKPGEHINDFIHNMPKLPPHLRRIEFSQSGMIYAVGNMILIEPNDQLEYFDISGNVFYSLTGPFRTFKNLKHLDISKNYISYVNWNMFQFVRSSLENLQIQNNYIGIVFTDKHNGPFIFNNLTELKTLNLSYNFISDIPANLLLHSHKVETLDLSVNNIKNWTLDVNQLDCLLHLILRNNFFQVLPDWLLNRLEQNTKQKGEQFTIDLRNNTIQIGCDRKDFLQWLVKHQNNMVGFEEYIFMNSEGGSITLDEFKRAVSNLDKQCHDYTLILVWSVIFSLTVLFSIMCALIYNRRWKLRYVLRYAKIKRLGYKPIHDGSDSKYRFDVFVSYANENRDFIINVVYPKLTQKGLKVYLHAKYSLPGNNIADNILDAIASSRLTLVILSNAYVTTGSKWCLYEFNMARMESIERSESSCLSLVVFEDMLTEKMPNEMLQWIGRNQCLEYDDHLFWEKLDKAVTPEL